MLPPFRAVILDLDGLLLDTEPTYRRAWRQTAAELGFDFTEDLARRLEGQSIDAVARILSDAFGPGFDFETFHRLSARRWHQWVEAHGIPVKPGYGRLMEVLRRRRIPYLLATNSQRRYAVKCLTLAGIAADFPVIVSRDDVTAGKPEPEIYLRACETLALPPAQCLAVEDSLPGILAAHRAGTQPVLVTDGNLDRHGDALENRLVARYPSLERLADCLDRTITRYLR